MQSEHCLQDSAPCNPGCCDLDAGKAKPAFRSRFRSEAAQTGMDTRRATERNAVDMPGSAAAVESCSENSALRTFEAFEPWRLVAAEPPKLKELEESRRYASFSCAWVRPGRMRDWCEMRAGHEERGAASGHNLNRTARVSKRMFGSSDGELSNDLRRSVIWTYGGQNSNIGLLARAALLLCRIQKSCKKTRNFSVVPQRKIQEDSIVSICVLRVLRGQDFPQWPFGRVP
jgi:hypothetical protein